MNLGKQIPDFKAETTEGPLQMYEYIKDSWSVLMTHPASLTPVCTTEMSEYIKLIYEFENRKTKLLTMSFDSKEKNKQWVEDIIALSKVDSSKPLPFPLIADENREIGVMLGMIEKEKQNAPGIYFPARHCVIIGPDTKIKGIFVHSASTGRNMTEILRALDSAQLTFKTGVATPVNWKIGDNVIVPEKLPKDQVEKFVKNLQTVALPSKQTYLQVGELK
ncbi:peroxiredoxin-6-like isoform X1 [Engystomops pustulosus]|uniref:peroxiredoxin-6-like isoform X1 n=1 Tax=Engystomops pustulosus TaxID=76066 RepID=UPI003AFAA0DA